MGEVIRDDKKEHTDNNNVITEACRKLGVSFGCQSGACGTCMIEVLEGADNLTPLTEAEQAMGLAKNERLACQCTLKQGIIKIRY
jgi:ferredoxin